jgi:hypothetical protein
VTDERHPAADDTPEGSHQALPASPGERRLARPPSDRYRVAEAELSPTPDPAASRARGVAFAAVAGLAGAAAITILGGVLAVSAGLLVVAATTGWAVAIGVRVGAGGQLTRGGRVRLALTLTLAAIALGQAGLWVYARSEGGVLAPLDYLSEVFGALVPAQIVTASVVAWITAR